MTTTAPIHLKTIQQVLPFLSIQDKAVSCSRVSKLWLQAVQRNPLCHVLVEQERCHECALMAQAEAFQYAETMVRRVFRDQFTPSYDLEGREEYLVGPTNSTVFLKQLLKMHGKKDAFKLLDIGTAGGELVSFCRDKLGIESFGTSASDLRKDPSKPSDEDYFIFDSTQIRAYSPLNKMKFNCIIAVSTFPSFKDPLDALVQAYDLLAPGGVMYVGEINCYGLNGRINKLLEWLNENGYEVSGTYHVSEAGRHTDDVLLSSFFILKTREHLQLPVLYRSTPQFATDKRGKVLGVAYKFDPSKINTQDAPDLVKQLSSVNIWRGRDSRDQKVTVLPKKESQLFKIYEELRS